MRFPVLLALAAILAGAPWGNPAAAQDLALGEKVYGLCTQCHGVDGGGDALAKAPAIAGLDAWYTEAQLAKFRSGARGYHAEDASGLRMRPMSMSLKGDDQVAAVAAYIASMPPTRPEPTVEGGDAERGRVLYAPCAACHGADGAGNQQVAGAPLRNSSDWYLLQQLHNYRSGMRGAGPGDAQGAIMRGMAATLADEQAMKDVVAYIMTLSQ